MDHQRRPSVAERGVAIVAEIDVLIHYRKLRLAFGVHRKVVHVPGMRAVRILQAVLLAIRIECGPADLKSGASHLAFW